jgi:hypothetical protein
MFVAGSIKRRHKMRVFGARIFKKNVRMTCRAIETGGVSAEGCSYLCGALLLLRSSVPDFNRAVVPRGRQLVSVPAKGDGADQILVPAQRQHLVSRWAP